MEDIAPTIFETDSSGIMLANKFPAKSGFTTIAGLSLQRVKNARVVSDIEKRMLPDGNSVNKADSELIKVDKVEDVSVTADSPMSEENEHVDSAERKVVARTDSSDGDCIPRLANAQTTENGISSQSSSTFNNSRAVQPTRSKIQSRTINPISTSCGGITPILVAEESSEADRDIPIAPPPKDAQRNAIASRRAMLDLIAAVPPFRLP